MPTLWEIEQQWIRLVADIRSVGTKIDREFCEPRMRKGYDICTQIKYNLGWNPGSPKQLGKFLLEDMGYPVFRRTENGAPSFDKKALEEYEIYLAADGSDVAKQVLRYRGWQKTASSNYKAYLDLVDRYDILHPNYKVHGTKTGRLSCESPNLQQIPRSSETEWNGDLKQAFVPRGKLLYSWYKLQQGFSKIPDLDETVLVEFDYAQLEMRLAAAVAKEEELLEAFRADEDVFQTMADRLGWLRQNVKTFYYATSYGAGTGKIALTFGISKEEAEEMRHDFHKAYPNLKKKSDKAALVAKSQGYIEYWTGRRRHLTGNYYKTFNAYIQGGAFEIVKRSGLRAKERVPAPIVLTVHDSYVFEIPKVWYTEEFVEAIKLVLEAVPEAEAMGVPFKVDAKLWGSK